MAVHAEDAIALLDHLGLKNAHLVGLVGIGACICQEIAIRSPDLARSMFNMGAWCEPDPFLCGSAGNVPARASRCGLPGLPASGHPAVLHSRVLQREQIPPAWARSRMERAQRPVRGALAAHRCLRHIQFARAFMRYAPEPHHPRRARSGDEPTHHENHRARDSWRARLLWDDVAHVVAGQEQKIRFCDTLLDWLADA